MVTRHDRASAGSGIGSPGVAGLVADVAELLGGETGRSRRFLGGLVAGALVGAALVGGALRRRRGTAADDRDRPVS
jgi:hypothetical protein